MRKVIVSRFLIDFKLLKGILTVVLPEINESIDPTKALYSDVKGYAVYYNSESTIVVKGTPKLCFTRSFCVLCIFLPILLVTYPFFSYLSLPNYFFVFVCSVFFVCSVLSLISSL